jgi:predicted dehydrogenase
LKRYAICGVSSRAHKMFIEPMLKTFKISSKLVALLDIDPMRFKVTADKYPQTKEVATFLPNEFDRMMKETKPDVIIVVGADHSHAQYITKALAYDVDVITEKPMATTSAQCRDILEAEKKSKGKVTVTFNYRYAPIHRRLKELVMEDKVGRITSVDLNWYVDTHHGSSYFKRWNRTRANSGCPFTRAPIILIWLTGGSVRNRLKPSPMAV